METGGYWPHQLSYKREREGHLLNAFNFDQVCFSCHNEYVAYSL